MFSRVKGPEQRCLESTEPPPRPLVNILLVFPIGACPPSEPFTATVTCCLIPRPVRLGSRNHLFAPSLLSITEGWAGEVKPTTTSPTLAKIATDHSPLLEAPDAPFFYPPSPDTFFVAKLRRTSKWSLVEARFSTFLYILFEPP